MDIESFNAGIEKAARLFNEKEVKYYLEATWDRSQITSGSKYCVPTNGPAISCVLMEKFAAEIRALKKKA